MSMPLPSQRAPYCIRILSSMPLVCMYMPDLSGLCIILARHCVPIQKLCTHCCYHATHFAVYLIGQFSPPGSLAAGCEFAPFGLDTLVDVVSLRLSLYLSKIVKRYVQKIADVELKSRMASI